MRVKLYGINNYLGCLHVGQLVMALIIIITKLEQDSLFAEASQLYSDLKFYFLLQICWVWVRGICLKEVFYL